MSTKFQQQRIEWIKKQISAIDTDFDSQPWWTALENIRRLNHLHLEWQVADHKHIPPVAAGG